MKEESSHALLRNQSYVFVLLEGLKGCSENAPDIKAYSYQRSRGADALRSLNTSGDHGGSATTITNFLWHIMSCLFIA